MTERIRLEDALPERLADRLRREDQRREEVTVAELARTDPLYAMAGVQLHEADLDEAPGAVELGRMVARLGVGNTAVAADMRAIGLICRVKFGLQVLEASGWTTRGRSNLLAPRFVVCHHTAATVDVTNLLMNGRTGLPGPLCNFELRKDSTVVLVASGRANHAGIASVSSAESYGIEATGPIPITRVGPTAFPQYRAYCQLVAAIRMHHGWGSDRVKAHKEIALPAGRKIDPVFNMDAFRADVQALMPRPPTPQPPTREDDLAGEGPRILAQLRAYAEGQPDFAESNEALWDRLKTVERKVETTDRKIDAIIAHLGITPPT